MSGWETFWVTFSATFIATVPAVFIGLFAERRFAHRERIKAARAVLTLKTEAGNPLYDTRDWANAVSANAANGAPLGVSNSVGSATALRILYTDYAMSDREKLELASLVPHVERLHALVDPIIGQTTPSATAQFIIEEADYIARVSGSLINAAQKERAVEAGKK